MKKYYNYKEREKEKYECYIVIQGEKNYDFIASVDE